jgi:Uma2 family endonuclease
MSALPQIYFSLDEYVALEKASNARYEWHDGSIVLMSGGSVYHEIISTNVAVSLANRLRGKSCRTFTGGMPLDVPATTPYRYPDVSVVCGKPEVTKFKGIDRLTNPTLIVEVLSPTTEAYDRGEKFVEYQSIPTFAEYLLIAQDRPSVVQRIRRPDGSWEERTLTGLDAVVRIEVLDCDVSLGEIYEAVEF